jgi:hypothetical protein
MTRSFGGPGGKPKDRAGEPSWGATPGGAGQVKPVRIDLGKRVVALIIDFAAIYLAGAVIALIPFVSIFLPLQLTMALLWLARDYFFQGRGVGKNLMGLRVVDVATGQPCSLLQSFQRNIVIMAPFVVVQAIDLVLRFVPIAWLNQAVVNIVQIVGMIYCIVVIPVEAYRAYSRDDGLRFGDELAGTALVEAPMDFSTPIPRQ